MHGVGNLLVSMLELSISLRSCALASILIHILKKNKKNALMAECWISLEMFLVDSERELNIW